MNISNFAHAGYAVLIQLIVWWFTGDALAGGLLGIGLFLGREHSQAEYRAINTDFGGKRANMPWYAGFNPKYWKLDGYLDALFPVVATSIIYILLTNNIL